jgi:molybdopterin converting factor small subunit
MELKEPPMEITVQFEAQLRHVAGVGQAVVSVPEGCSVGDAHHAVSAQFGPTLAERLVTADGTAQRSVLLFVNDQAIAHAMAAGHLLKARDVLLLYPPISGG